MYHRCYAWLTLTARGSARMDSSFANSPALLRDLSFSDFLICIGGFMLHAFCGAGRDEGEFGVDVAALFLLSGMGGGNDSSYLAGSTYTAVP